MRLIAGPADLCRRVVWQDAALRCECKFLLPECDVAIGTAD